MNGLTLVGRVAAGQLTGFRMERASLCPVLLHRLVLFTSKGGQKVGSLPHGCVMLACGFVAECANQQGFRVPALTLRGGSSEFKFMCVVLVTDKVTASYPIGIIFSQVECSQH